VRTTRFEKILLPLKLRKAIGDGEAGWGRVEAAILDGNDVKRSQSY
jgi:hypothetical protein